MHHKVSRLILVMTAAMATCAMAQNQPATGRIVFGDSLSDTGNVYRVIGQPPVIGGPASSDAGRYSNGPMWVDLIAPGYAFYANPLSGGNFPAGTTSVNFAVGGSQSCGLANCDGVSGLQAFAINVAPGALVQINDYLSNVKAGKLPAISPTTQYFIFTGGNDYTPYAASAGAGASATGEQALVSKVLGNINTGIARLTAEGARQLVVFNQFDIGLVPQFLDPKLASGLPSNAAKVATELSNLHNAQLPERLKEASAATGASIIQVDVNRLFRDQFNNPAIWGLTNVTGTCVAGDFTTTTGLCTTKAQADQLMFWQPTHPTAITHARIAALVDGTLHTVNHAPAAIAVQSQLSMRAAEASADLIADRLDGLFKQGRSVFLDAGNDDGTRNAEVGRAGYDFTVRQASIGVSHPLAKNTLFGLSVSNGNANAKLKNGAGATDADTVGFGAFLAFRQDAVTTLLEAGGLRTTFNTIDRASGFSYFPTANGTSKSSLWSLSASARYRIPMGGFDLSPQLGLRHSNVTVDAYQESGSRLLDLAVSEHSLRSNLATVGVRMDGSFVMGDVNVFPQLDVDYLHELSGEGETIMASLPSGQEANGVSEVGSRKALKVKFGLGFLFSEKTRLTALLQKRFADEGGNSLLANITLTHSF